MTEDYKVGDVVILRSGGPAMTVIEIRADGFIGARWFVNDHAYPVITHTYPC